MDGSPPAGSRGRSPVESGAKPPEAYPEADDIFSK